MGNHSKKTRISLDCMPDEHLKIKLYATLHKKTISEYILDLVREGMRQEGYQVPNLNSESQEVSTFSTSSITNNNG